MEERKIDWIATERKYQEVHKSAVLEAVEKPYDLSDCFFDPETESNIVINDEDFEDCFNSVLRKYKGCIVYK